jgi:outer membrane protein assembly factor BamD (BamD/ComL family)
MTLAQQIGNKRRNLSKHRCATAAPQAGSEPAAGTFGGETQLARSRTRPTAFLAALISLLCVSLFGCRSSLEVSSQKLKDDAKTREMASIENTRGPLERMLQAQDRERELQDQSLAPAAGLQEFEQAEKQYDDGNYKAAEKAFKKIAKRYKDNQIAEDALFMVAESQFRRQRYSWAQDSYDRLLKEYPTTRYLEPVTQRLFEIARIWLQDPEVVTSGDIQQVDYDNPGTPLELKQAPKKPRGISQRIPIWPNLFDRTRPVFDTEGRALQALKSIWTKDSTGPLAADSLMLTAGHFLRKGDYLAADGIYTTLRELYPKSPHFENAYLLGSHVKLMSYDGAAYDDTSLEEARKLKQSALRMFPNTQRGRLREELRKIDEAKAASEWEMARFWQKKRNPRAVAISCEKILEIYPNTSYADKARQKLAKLGPELGDGVGDDQGTPSQEQLPQETDDPGYDDSNYDDPGYDDSSYYDSGRIN